MMKLAIATLAGILATSPAYSLTALERMILEELSCESSPSPTAIIRELAARQLISLDKNLGYDSLSCWVLEREFTVSGVRFASVCAFEEDEGIRSRNTDIYYRGPGTSPGQTLSFGSPIAAEELADWYLETFGAARVSSAISEGNRTTLGDRSEVSCTSWMR